MPRAHRYALPACVWHIKHRCYKGEYLLKFAQDRDRWCFWLHEARKRYGLGVLNYIVSSDHVHLLVHDQGKGEIAKSMRLIAEQTTGEYNRCMNRNGAYWEERFHAKAVEINRQLERCMAYIDLSMVREGVVVHPEDWIWGGYYDIQYPSQQYRVIDETKLLELNGVSCLEHYRDIRRLRVESESARYHPGSDEDWRASPAAGSTQCINAVPSALETRGQRTDFGPA